MKEPLFAFQEEVSYTFPKKLPMLIWKKQKSSISYNNQKSKKYLILIQKTNFWYFPEKVKELHFRCVLNTARLYFNKN